MKKVYLGVAPILLFCFLVLSGCANFTAPSKLGSGGYIPIHTSEVVHKFDKDNFSVLGPVTVKAEGISILFGLFTNGDNGFRRLFEEARTKYPDVDALVNLMEDTHVQSYIIYAKNERILTATAIKYKK